MGDDSIDMGDESIYMGFLSLCPTDEHFDNEHGAVIRVEETVRASRREINTSAVPPSVRHAAYLWGRIQGLLSSTFRLNVSTS